MSFGEPWMFFLPGAFLVWLLWAWTRGSARWPIWLHVLAFAALLLVVSTPGMLNLIDGEQARLPLGGSEDAAATSGPAKLSRPGAGRASCFVLVMEMSSSMDGNKLGLAKLAALDVVENLRHGDKLGVLAFNDNFHWVMPIGVVNDRDVADDAIEHIVAAGGKRIAPALVEALRRIVLVEASSKHILLFTDVSIDKRDAAFKPARRFATHGISISTVEFGIPHPRGYPGRVPAWSAGEVYSINDPLQIESTVGRDTIQHDGLGTDTDLQSAETSKRKPSQGSAPRF